jgi:hypothetical protein
VKTLVLGGSPVQEIEITAPGLTPVRRLACPSKVHEAAADAIGSPTTRVVAMSRNALPKRRVRPHRPEVV